MENSLKRYDSLIDILKEDSYEIKHQNFKGHFGGCNYKSRYDPI